MKFKIASAIAILGAILLASAMDDLLKISLIEEFGLTKKQTVIRIMPYIALVMIGIRWIEIINKKNRPPQNK